MAKWGSKKFVKNDICQSKKLNTKCKAKKKKELVAVSCKIL